MMKRTFALWEVDQLYLYHEFLHLWTTSCGWLLSWLKVQNPSVKRLTMMMSLNWVYSDLKVINFVIFNIIIINIVIIIICLRLKKLTSLKDAPAWKKWPYILRPSSQSSQKPSIIFHFSQKKIGWERRKYQVCTLSGATAATINSIIFSHCHNLTSSQAPSYASPKRRGETLPSDSLTDRGEV